MTYIEIMKHLSAGVLLSARRTSEKYGHPLDRYVLSAGCLAKVWHTREEYCSDYDENMRLVDVSHSLLFGDINDFVMYDVGEIK